jgi:hypothetical protein
MRLRLLVAAGASAIALSGCGAEAPGEDPTPTGPFSQDATADCLEDAGYSFEIGHGDPPSMRAEDIVFMIWLEDLGEIEFFHPSAEVTTEGERYDNAVVVWDENVSPEDRDTIVGCLR